MSWIKNQDKNYGMKSRYMYTKLIFGTSNFVVFYVSIKHVTCFLQGLHPIFMGEDDTWDACLKYPSSGFSGKLHFRGAGIKLRRGYAPSQSPKANPCIYFYGFMVGRSYIILCSIISALVSYSS